MDRLTVSSTARPSRRGVLQMLAGSGILFALGSSGRVRAQEDATLGDDALGDVIVAVPGEPGRRGLDASPSPDGMTTYFTATGAGGPGVFRVAAEGGEVIALAVGLPFVAPRGVAVATDGRTLYVADPAAAGATGAGGQLLTLSVDGGEPTPVPGSEGTAPRAVDVASRSAGDLLIFAGLDPATGQPAVLSLPAASATAPAVLATGAPLIVPDGIAVASSGDVYVSDRGPAGVATGGRVYRVEDGRLELVVADLRAGDPARIALVSGETILAVSALDPVAGTARVLLVDLATGQTGVATKGIGANRGAGGLHRARQTEDLAWADSSAGGAVYRISGRA